MPHKCDCTPPEEGKGVPKKNRSRSGKKSKKARKNAIFSVSSSSDHRYRSTRRLVRFIYEYHELIMVGLTFLMFGLTFLTFIVMVV